MVSYACPAALRLRGPTVSGLTGYIRRPDKRSAIRHKTGMAPEVSCPATLRLPGLGYMRLRVAVDTVFGLQLSRPDNAFITCNFSEICAPG